MAENITYRGYRVIYGLLAGQQTARVFRDKTLLHEKTGATAFEAVERAKAWIDEFVSATVAARRVLHLGTENEVEIGTVGEYVDFFSTEKIIENHRLMLIGHASAPERVMTAGQIGRCGGYPDFSTTNIQYGTLGGRISDRLNLRLPRGSDGKRVATYAIADNADVDAEKSEGNFRWRMHDEVAEALGLCNMLGPAERASVVRRQN